MADHDACRSSADPAAAPDAKSQVDPVCGMKVAANPEKSAAHAGRTFYFCSQGCIAKFRADPERYLSKKNALPPAAGAMIYTCPMHPEVRHIGPGICPKCGMALEPLTASVEEDTSELDDMMRRLRVGVALTLPLLAITMSGFIPGFDLSRRLGNEMGEWLQALLATPVVLW